MIFLSHSSVDKPLVEQVAFELNNEGIDVWLDKWEIENGDLLDEKINEGIKDSSFVIVFLTPDSVKSSWVQKELNETINKEKNENKKCLLLVKLKNCNLDEEINNRLYTDFTTSFTRGVSELTRLLKANSQDVEKLTNPIIPIKINHLLHVDTQSLYRLFSRIGDTVKIHGIKKEQILIVQDEEYYKFKSLAYQKFDEFRSIKTNSEQISYFRDVLRTVEDLEETLTDGIVLILLRGKQYDYLNLIESVKWFYRSIIFTIGSKLDQLLNYKVQDFLGTELTNSPFSTKVNLVKFYNVEHAMSFDIWIEGNSQDYIKFWVGDDSYVYHDHKEFPFRKRFAEVNNHIDCFKYLVPQMVRGGLLNTKLPIWWDFDKAVIGPS